MLVYGEKDGENETIGSEILSNVGECFYDIESRIKIRCMEKQKLEE